MARLEGISANLAAFLDLIAWSEIGDRLLEASDDGYNVLVGGKLFDSYKDHPRTKVDIPRLHIYSTAAGRYQIMMRTWNEISEQAGLSDFCPTSQDVAAIRLLKRRHALKEIEAGNIAGAIYLCGKEWASFPDNNYKQGGHKLSTLLEKYKELRNGKEESSTEEG